MLTSQSTPQASTGSGVHQFSQLRIIKVQQGEIKILRNKRTNTSPMQEFKEAQRVPSYHILCRHFLPLPDFLYAPKTRITLARFDLHVWLSLSTYSLHLAFLICLDLSGVCIHRHQSFHVPGSSSDRCFSCVYFASGDALCGLAFRCLLFYPGCSLMNAFIVSHSFEKMLNYNIGFCLCEHKTSANHL
ncbi:hypothetical protein M513_12529 [Trichuris suis]|uniref:Uncharacterized protein n=1 Tax=Trichuris suis TaxID=68888 RepID=A0A085LNP9_9BILA|nr:hypothetical protein M513_12529 [Trichuris suis]